MTLYRKYRTWLNKFCQLLFLFKVDQPSTAYDSGVLKRLSLGAEIEVLECVEGIHKGRIIGESITDKRRKE